MTYTPENIETATGITKRTDFQASNLDADATIIPAAGSGTPKVSTVTKISGHTRQVTLTAPSHGTITATYKDENNADQTKTATSGGSDVVFNVAQTCNLTITSTAATGYNPATLKVNDVDHTSGSVYVVRDVITVTATFEAKQCTITFDKEGGTGGDNGTTATYDADMNTVTIPHKIGYSFAGYWDGDNGTGNQYYNADGTSYRTWNKNTTSDTPLYAKWVADNKTFNGGGVDNNWTTPGNWTGGVAPTDDYSSVTINAEVELSSSVHIGELTIGASGKLIIQPTGALEVAGTITNSNSENIVINTTSSSQGALICDLSSAPAATVNMTLPSSDFHLIASPTGGARVSSTFAGKGIYTYAWKEGKGWDHRGYYEDFTGGEAILIYGTTSCGFSGYLANFCGGSTSYDDDSEAADAQGVNMLSNTLTAPVLISAMTLTNSYDGNIYLLESGVWQSYSTASGTNVIPALNGYAVISKSGGGSVSFDYTTAVRRASSKNAGLKAPQRATDDAQDYMTIFVTTNERKIDLILYEDATKFTDTVDIGYEACYIEGDGRFGQLYAHAERKMTKLAKANLEGTVLGFAPGEAESFTISFEGDGKGYYLNDVVTCKSTLIDENNIYEFTSDENTNDTRFVISKTPISKTPTSVDNITDGVKARKQLIDGTLYIIRDGRIYTATGAAVK